MVNILIAVNVAVFLVMAVVTGTVDPSARTMLAWGGDLGRLTLHGEPWRLVSSQYLHLGIQHILGNMFLLAVTGRFLSRLMPAAVILGVYTACGVVAGLASAIAHPYVVGVGASGAIAGLMGVIVVLWASRRHPDIPGAWVLQTLAINAVYSLVPGVDWAAHLGGLLAGLVCGGALLFILPPGAAPPPLGPQPA